ncbi:MAG: hypothetical protein ACR2PS_02680, partial [Pseudomonadales bacterium]
NRLPSGIPWTMPIVLQVDKSSVEDICVGNLVALTNGDGRIHATLDVTEIYSCDFDELAQSWFGTTSRKHPGVVRLAAGGNRFVAGEITLVAPLASPHERYELKPTQTRLIFSQKGWSKVVGFHTRNVPHRVHEFIQLRALENEHADGLYISPVIGPKKSGDFLADPILQSYQLLLETSIYPTGKVVLGAFSTYSRYCGPREAVFTAICRKNAGCSHFIVGRDHTGVGDFYDSNDCKALFDWLGDIGIEPVFFDAIGYDTKGERYVDLSACETAEPISGTQIRKALIEGDVLPNWMMRSEVQDVVRAEQMMNYPLFQE